jgi:predicted transcriptional regulator
MTKTRKTSKRRAKNKTKPVTKIASVIALLERKSGATLVELSDATGWQPHSIRAALTGLKKKGHAIARTNRGAETCYRIGGAI